MKFKLNIEINMDNAAFIVNPHEVKHIVSNFINDKGRSFSELTPSTWAECTAFIDTSERWPLKDSNGNTVGYAAAEVTE